MKDVNIDDIQKNVNFDERQKNDKTKKKDMKGFKKCDKGHFYKDDLDECNYCPKPQTPVSNDKTEMIGGNDGTVKIENDKTQVFGAGQASSGASQSSSNFDPEKTIISGASTSSDDDSSQNIISKRKLRGWLVTFDHEEFGLDFKINEGRNTIGKSPSSNIKIQDNEVTGLHAIILCRKDKFILTDEVSTNGTTLNGNELTPREAYEINDGDEIKMGNTNLLFKTAFKK